jgi:uracil-DNA glycosylase
MWGVSRIGIIPKIDDLFHGKFLEDFDAEHMSFSRFYWTHYIKCPGNLRNQKFKLRGLNLDVCADTFLLKEVDVLRPELIVCMGEHASTWIFEENGVP